MLDGEAEMLEQYPSRRGFAEAVDADDCPWRSSTAPTYLRQKSVTPASTATRGTPGGSTLARHAASWRSKTLVHGIETTRDGDAVGGERVCAPIASATSEPVRDDHARLRARGVGEHVAAAADRGDLRGAARVGRERSAA